MQIGRIHITVGKGAGGGKVNEGGGNGGFARAALSTEDQKLFHRHTPASIF
ncbi:hypothetical protein SDC9_212398 [bioreactor metagenome]|uniref:Uncharacterized protein n=1 Tax=bioreactor metagenome TaxID=1076179 RepID=A0A645JMV3_9ZZZZ